MLQQKKRLSASSIAGCSSRQPSRAKRKNLGSTQCGLNTRSHISLNWDDNKKRVVAKREQIAISWRDLSPFINTIPHRPSVLADILSVPLEIFELENLTDVLSFEVWQMHLSEKERDFLTQFLPSGLDEQQVVQTLLAGDNFHFGNPFLKWGASLCSGNLHPDAVLSEEQCLKANKKAYYLELQEYHNDNIANLQEWKERWASCKDPEKEVVQNMWRSRKIAEKNISSHANESRFHDSEENLADTSESCSWAADEKAYSSDNQNSSRKGGELKKGGNFIKVKCNSPVVVASNGLKAETEARKSVKFSKNNIHYADGARYMSYIKISKRQHQLVKSMKQSGNSIQPKSLNRILGDFDSFHIRPYELFEAEEQKKLHEYWLQVVNRDLPAAFANRRKIQIQRQQMAHSLAQELEEKLKPLVEDDKKETPDSSLQGEDDGATDHEPTMENDGKPVLSPNQNQPVAQIPVLNENLEFDAMDMDDEDNHVVSKLDDDSPSEKSEGSGNLSHENVSVSQGLHLSSGGDVHTFSSADAYYGSTSLNHEHASARDSDVGHSQIIEQKPSCLIDLGSEMREECSGKDMVHRESNHDSFFSLYPNLDRSGLHQSFIKAHGVLPYHHDQEQTGVDFHPTTNVLMEAGQFPGHLQEQLQVTLPLEQRQKRQNEIYMLQNMQNMYSDVGRYSIPRPEHFSTANMHDWSVDPAPRISMPLQPHLNGGDFIGHNWLLGEHRTRSGWSGSDGVGVLNHGGIGSRSNTDGSLFSVLSHCRELQSGGPYESMATPEQFISSRNYGSLVGGIPRSTTVLPQTGNPLNYFSGREATATPKNSNLGWSSLPHQNSALNDSIGEPFLRSWNQ